MKEYRKRCKKCLTVTSSNEPLENGEPCEPCVLDDCVTEDSYLIDYWKPFPDSIQEIDMSKLYNRIQAEFDKCRVDEWHSVIPLSEDGWSMYDDLGDVSYPGGDQQNGLFLHENETGHIEPKNSYTYNAFTSLFEDADYIYNIFAISGGCDHHEGHLAQITRLDKNPNGGA